MDAERQGVVDTWSKKATLTAGQMFTLSNARIEWGNKCAYSDARRRRRKAAMARGEEPDEEDYSDEE